MEWISTCSLRSAPSSFKSGMIFLLLMCLFGTLPTVPSMGSSGRLPRSLANYTGDVMLGALFPIHSYNHDTQICERIQGQDGIQLMEAMLYSLDDINSSGFLPGFTLGTLIADTCDSETVALERSVEFVRDLTDSLSYPDKLPLQCSDGSTPQRTLADNLDRIVGVVGGSASLISTQVASFLRLFKVPQVSYLSTTPELSNKERYDYFLRTVPADTFQAMAIVKILSRFKWTYVSAVYDDSPYGSEGFGAVEKLAVKAGICFAVVRKIRRYPSSPGDDLNKEMEQVVKDLAAKKSARAVVVFTNHNQARMLFSAASKNRDADGFIWIGSDGWSGRESVVEDLERVVENSITVQPLARKLDGFDEYFTNLKPSFNTRNPWFRQFWAYHFKCHWSESSPQWRQDHLEKCDEDKRLSSDNGYRQFLALTFVRNAVQVYAHALKNMHTDRCANISGLCSAMEVSKISGPELLSYMENVTFPEGNNLQFSFVNRVDGPPRYSIFTYKRKGKDYRWVEIGNYTHENGQEKILLEDLFDIRGDYPTSFCSSPCATHQATKTLETDKCCWVCVNCTYYQYLPTEDQCEDCQLGFLPNTLYNACVPIPEEYVAHGQPLSVGLSSFSLFGVIICMVIGAIFYKYRLTPVIKASGKELSFVLLAGVTLSYAATLAFVDEPSRVSCGFTRFLFGFSYTICYAAILTKTNRIARIFHGGEKGAVKTRFTTPKSQLIFVAVLTFVEVLVIIAWSILQLPDVSHLYPTRADNIRICAESDDASYLIGLIYPFLLVVLCTFYAVKTRKTPDGFNEARFIAFCAYSTCILWISFVPIYFANSDHALRIVTMSVSLSANSTVIIVCLFLPKMYIVIFRPNKNTREAVMARSTANKSSEDKTGSLQAQRAENEQNISRRVEQENDEEISVISRPEVFPEQISGSLTNPDHLYEMYLQNQSTDSGCYVNVGYRDSQTFLTDSKEKTHKEESVDVESVEVDTC